MKEANVFGRRGRFALLAFWFLCCLAAAADWLLGYETIPAGCFWWPALGVAVALAVVAFLVRSCRSYLVELTGPAGPRRSWKSWAYLGILTAMTSVGIEGFLDLLNGALAERPSQQRTLVISSKFAYQTKLRHYQVCAPYWNGAPREFCLHDVPEGDYDRTVSGKSRLRVSTRTGWFGVVTVVGYEFEPGGQGGDQWGSSPWK